jgi:hypothetical protein
MMSYAILSVFIVELALTFVGAGVTRTALYDALINPPSLIVGAFYIGLILIVGAVALTAVITPGFIYQVNQWALFAGAVAVLITFVAVIIDLWVFIQSEIIDFTPEFAGLIASLVTAPLIILYIFAGLEWTRFNQ